MALTRQLSCEEIKDTNTETLIRRCIVVVTDDLGNDLIASDGKPMLAIRMVGPDE